MPNSVKLKALLPEPIVTLSGGRLKVVSPGAVPPGISAGFGISSVAMGFPFPFAFPFGGGAGGGSRYCGAASSGAAGGGGGAAVSAGGGGGALSSFGCAYAGPAAAATSARVVSSDFPRPDVTLSFIFFGASEAQKPACTGPVGYGLPRNEETARIRGGFASEIIARRSPTR